MRFIQNKKIYYITTLSIAAICFIIFSGIFIYSRYNVFPQIYANITASKARASFPEIDTSQLGEDQIKLVEILKAEYELNPDGTKYSEGVKEPWCANFVSWVFNQAGKPLKNPNSGSWRIPGTYTLRDYYESTDRFMLAESGYSPKVGDTMLYDNPSSFGQHTNIVIKNEGGVLTTIGGNEPGGIRIVEHHQKDTVGFIGYGVF